MNSIRKLLLVGGLALTVLFGAAATSNAQNFSFSYSSGGYYHRPPAYCYPAPPPYAYRPRYYYHRPAPRVRYYYRQRHHEYREHRRYEHREHRRHR